MDTSADGEPTQESANEWFNNQWDDEAAWYDDDAGWDDPEEWDDTWGDDAWGESDWAEYEESGDAETDIAHLLAAFMPGDGAE